MKKRCERIVVVFINQRPLQKVTMWSSRNKMLLDAEGDGEDDVAFLPGSFVCLFVCSVVCF